MLAESQPPPPYPNFCVWPQILTGTFLLVAAHLQPSCVLEFPELIETPLQSMMHFWSRFCVITFIFSLNCLMEKRPVLIATEVLEEWRGKYSSYIILRFFVGRYQIMTEDIIVRFAMKLNVPKSGFYFPLALAFILLLTFGTQFQDFYNIAAWSNCSSKSLGTRLFFNLLVQDVTFFPVHKIPTELCDIFWCLFIEEIDIIRTILPSIGLAGHVLLR